MAESLGLQEEMAKARVRVKISEHDNHDQEMTFKSEEHKRDYITYYKQSSINKQQISQYRTFTIAFLKKIMARNLSKPK